MNAPSLSGAIRRVLFFLSLASAAWAAEPVQFVFHLPAEKRDPFSRDLWAEVVTPSRKVLRLPVFFYGNNEFAVRARATELGDYSLRTVTEKTGDTVTSLSFALSGEVKQRVKTLATLPQVMGYNGKPARFLFGNSEPFSPIGANVPWASSAAERVKFYDDAISAFNREGLNWMRIWMAHWGGLNLDWLPEGGGASPPPGILDLRIAVDWDHIIAAAEDKGVYLQIVLQHHGQYSTTVNSNWAANPWNAANPRGFLKTPAEFFSSPTAVGLTALKYRYIVARWGYSPAILSWELFNEVHWTDPINQAHDDTAVAAWHTSMATYLRQMDRYHHLVTTSTENLGSAIYEKIDYYQPHLYAANILAGVREFSVAPDKLDRPIFYGEMGDDHMNLTPAQKNSGVAIVPPVWASLMGRGRYAAQPWLGDKLLQSERLGELGAVARFIRASGLGRRDNLTAFSPVVECAAHVPFTLAAGQHWQRWPAPEFEVPLDGREPIEFADVPYSYVNSPDPRAKGFPSRATYHLDFPREMSLVARVDGIGAKGGALRISTDGNVAVEKTWPAASNEAVTAKTAEALSFNVSAGRHTLVVENPGSPDWVGIAGIDFPVEIPILGAIGQRGKNFFALWIWHREGVFAVKAPAAVKGVISIDEVPAGSWRATWWDSLKGVPLEPTQIEHPGGVLKVPTPPIYRHAALVLEKN